MKSILGCAVVLFLFCLNSQAVEKAAQKKVSQKQVVKKKPAQVVFDDLKTCLLAMHDRELALLKKNERYMDSISGLHPEEVNSCNEVQLSFEMVEKMEFKIRGELKNSVWTIDNNRTLAESK